MRTFLFCIPVLAAAFASTPALAQWQYSGGAGVRYVNTTETDTNGQRLVREHGWLPGLHLNAEYSRPGWRYSLYGELYGADLDYDGHLQNGMPYSTDTGTTQSRLAFEVARELTEDTRLLGGIEYDFWQRNVVGRGNVAGVNERYTSWRLLAGAATTVLKLPAGSIGFKGLLVVARPEQMQVRFDNQLFDDTALSTKPSVGLRLTLSAQPVAYPRLSLGVALDWMQVRRSDDTILFRNGSPAGIVAQPEHQRSAIGFHANYRF